MSSSVRAGVATTSHAAFSEPESNDGCTESEECDGCADIDSDGIDSDFDPEAVVPHKARRAKSRALSSEHQGTIQRRSRSLVRKVASTGVSGVFEKTSTKCAPILRGWANSVVSSLWQFCSCEESLLLVL